MGIPVDVVFHPKWWHKNAQVNFSEEFFYDVEYRIEADMKMRRVLFDKFGDLGLGEENPLLRPLLGSDMIACGFLHSEILGCEVRYSDENPPEVICGNLSEEEVLRLSVPDFEASETWQKVQRNIDVLLERYGYVESYINLMGIQNIALDLRGPQLFMDYYNNPELARHLLKICTEVSMEVGRRLKEVSEHLSAGVTNIVKQTVPDVYLTSNCTVEMVSLEIYETFLLEWDNVLAEHFQPFGIHHCGQTMEHVANGYAKVKNVEFIEVGAGSDVAFVRRVFPSIYLNARYSPVRLQDVTDAELEEDIQRLVNAGKPNHLLSISCVGIDDTVSDEKIRRFIETCKQAG